MGRLIQSRIKEKNRIRIRIKVKIRELCRTYNCAIQHQNHGAVEAHPRAVEGPQVIVADLRQFNEDPNLQKTEKSDPDPQHCQYICGGAQVNMERRLEAQNPGGRGGAGERGHQLGADDGRAKNLFNWLSRCSIL